MIVATLSVVSDPPEAAFCDVCESADVSRVATLAVDPLDGNGPYLLCAEHGAEYVRRARLRRWQAA